MSDNKTTDLDATASGPLIPEWIYVGAEVGIMVGDSWRGNASAIVKVKSIGKMWIVFDDRLKRRVQHKNYVADTNSYRSWGRAGSASISVYPVGHPVLMRGVLKTNVGRARTRVLDAFDMWRRATDPNPSNISPPGPTPNLKPILDDYYAAVRKLGEFEDEQ